MSIQLENLIHKFCPIHSPAKERSVDQGVKNRHKKIQHYIIVQYSKIKNKKYSNTVGIVKNSNTVDTVDTVKYSNTVKISKMSKYRI